MLGLEDTEQICRCYEHTGLFSGVLLSQDFGFYFFLLPKELTKSSSQMGFLTHPSSGKDQALSHARGSKTSLHNLPTTGKLADYDNRTTNNLIVVCF